MPEFVPDPEQVVSSWLQGGRAPEDMQALAEVIERGRESGYLRDDIPCDEFRERFLEMAESLYVRNEPLASRPIKDYELGAHQGVCEEEDCQLLNKLYWFVLRPSRPEDAGINAQFLQAVRDKFAGLLEEE